MSRKNRIHPSNYNCNLFGLLTILSILMSLLLFFTSLKKEEEKVAEYCADFGSYGKSLVLFKNQTFKFSYNGCSVNRGYIQGKWTLRKNLLSLFTDEDEGLLDTKYHINDDSIQGVESDEAGFVICDKYIDPWERASAMKKKAPQHY